MIRLALLVGLVAQAAGFSAPCLLRAHSNSKIAAKGAEELRSSGNKGLSLARVAHSSALTLKASVPDVNYGKLQHAGVLVQDVEPAVKFYTEVLGMRNETHLRPNLPYDGAFIGCGSTQIHLMQLPDPDPKEGRPEHGGRDRHVAVTVANIDPLAERLKQNDVFFTMSKSGRRALFCRDIDQNAIEFMEDTSISS